MTTTILLRKALTSTRPTPTSKRRTRIPPPLCILACILFYYLVSKPWLKTSSTRFSLLFYRARSSYQSLDFEAELDAIDEQAPLLPKSKEALQASKRRRCVTGAVALLLVLLLVAVPAAWLGLRRLKHVKLF